MSVQHAGKRQFGLKAGDVAVNTSRKKQLTSPPPTQKTPQLCARLGFGQAAIRFLLVVDRRRVVTQRCRRGQEKNAGQE